MRYVKQPDNYSCGPITILNALKWAGIDATQSSYLTLLQFGCQTIDLEDPSYDNNGTTDADFDRVMRYVGKGNFTVKRKKHPTLKEMKKHLEKGGSIAISYRWNESNQIGDHFMFIIGLKRGCYVCVNDHRSPFEDTVSARTEATMKRWLKKGADYPNSWFLTKE